MAQISYVTQATATATSLTYPAGIQAGDYILYYGYRTTTTAPSLPTGFTNITTVSANVNSARVAYKIAAGTESGTTSPTYTNATQVGVAVYRNVTGIGANPKTKTGTTSPASFTAMTLSGTNGMSWISAFIGSKQGTSTATPTGLTNRGELKNSTTSMIDLYDTNAAVSTQSFGTSALGSSINWATLNVELLGTNSPPATPTISSPATNAHGVSPTPALSFSTTDSDSDAIAYEVEIDTVNTFDSSGAVSIVQRNSGLDAGTGTSSATFSSNVTAGNAVVVLTGINNNTSNTGTPSDGTNTYSLVANVYQSSMNVGFKVWVAYNVTGGAAYTVSATDSSNLQAIYIYEVANLDSVSSLDTFATQQITGTAVASPSITTTHGNELLLGFFGTEDITADTYTVGTGWSNIQTQAGANWSTAVEEQVVTTTGTYSATGGGPTGQISQCGIIALHAKPLIHGLSISGSHDAAQFSDTTNPGHSSPYPSGDSITFTVPSGEILASGSYFWRVRAIDALGSNTWSSWASSNFSIGSPYIVQSASHSDGSGTSTSVPITLGTTPTVGNLLIYFGSFDFNKTYVGNPSGWTPIITNPYTNARAAMSAVYRIVQAGDGTSWTMPQITTADTESGIMYEIGGQATSSFFNATATAGSASTVTSDASASVTPSVVGCLALAFFALDTAAGGTQATDTATITSGWAFDQRPYSDFHASWGTHRSLLTTNTTTAISATISPTSSSTNSSIILLIAPAGGGATVTKTQTAIARIALNRTVTTPAVARIAVNLTKTQSGVSRIATKSTLTRPATARVANITTKIQSATARIANTGLAKTQSAIARIANNRAVTQNAIARIANIRTATQPAIARIAKNLTKTQTATAHITAVVIKTQTATARIAANLTKTQAAVARIGASGTKTQGAISRIANILTKTQAATAHIAAVVIKTQQATARIAINKTHTQTAISRISNNFTKTQGATSRIAVIPTKTQPAVSHIAVVIAKTQPATGRIATSLAFTQPATAKIINTTNLTLTQPAIGRISQTLTKTQSATAMISPVRRTKTQTATASIATNKANDPSVIMLLGGGVAVKVGKGLYLPL